MALDETGATIAFTRRYARAPRHQRARGQVPKNYGQTTTLVTALTVDGFGPALTFPGALNTTAFRIYVRDLLAPTLRPGQVVVLDNLPAHHAADITDLIAQRGCEVLFLPSYSPDFNPIEPAFAKMKARLRAAEARTTEALNTAISQTIDCITPEDAQAFFRHCGYQAPASS